MQSAPSPGTDGRLEEAVFLVREAREPLEGNHVPAHGSAIRALTLHGLVAKTVPLVE
jgi:hypothetical protein